MANVRVRYLNGSDLMLSDVTSLTEIRIAIAARHHAFVPEITILDESATILLTGMMEEVPGELPLNVLTIINLMPNCIDRWNLGIDVHAKLGDIRGVERALAMGASTQMVVVDAATRGQVEVLRTLVAAGADVDTKDEYGMTALSWAAYRGRLETVRMLVDAGGDVNHRDCSGGTALRKAASNGRVEVVEILVSAGAAQY